MSVEYEITDIVKLAVIILRKTSATGKIVFNY